MNAEDRRLVGRVYNCLGKMSDLAPYNPADIAAMSRNVKIGAAASKSLRAALDCLLMGDHETAGEYVGDAETALSRRA